MLVVVENHMIHRTAKFQVLPEHLDKAVDLIKTFTAAVNSKEDRCLLYRSLRSEKHPSEFLHYMIFEDKEAEEFHRTTDHVNTFVNDLYPLLEQNPVFTSYAVIAD